MSSGVFGVLELRLGCSEPIEVLAALFTDSAATAGRAAGSRGVSRLCRVGQGDDLDVPSAQYFVKSSVAPVFLLRRRIKPVADVLKGMRHNGFFSAQVGCFV